jgi:hypothetical protein
MEATGRIESIRTGVAAIYQTDPQGNATLQNLPLGRYRIQVSKSGFTTQTMTTDMQSGTAIMCVVYMQIGAQEASLVVVSQTTIASASSH